MDNCFDEVDKQVDIITLIFVLSSLHPDNFTKYISNYYFMNYKESILFYYNEFFFTFRAIKNLYQVTKTNGVVLFRDYGRHDMAQLRFKAGHKISENFYMRQDGTR